jgi:hypothetical protein
VSRGVGVKPVCYCGRVEKKGCRGGGGVWRKLIQTRRVLKAWEGRANKKRGVLVIREVLKGRGNVLPTGELRKKRGVFLQREACSGSEGAFLNAKSAEATRGRSGNGEDAEGTKRWVGFARDRSPTGRVLEAVEEKKSVNGSYLLTRRATMEGYAWQRGH